ncbi:MAG TPA: DNA-3-methyladenine glycosylase [Gemmatimonadales bacterium]|nr:DNA-3-methyladenine glycosylase [Gemmatimonadales bacterium]
MTVHRPPLPQRFFRRRAEEVARDLLGASIRSTVAGHEAEGLIVETEAYLGFDDPASHGYRGRRHAGNANLYAPPGTWYVYRSYGIHWCANLVCGGAGGSAVLLRGVLPLRGLAIMRKRRGGVAPEVLANGPGKLCQALGITRELDGVPMRHSAVLVSEASDPAGDSVAVTPRIGITKAVDWPLRFVLESRWSDLPTAATA